MIWILIASSIDWTQLLNLLLAALGIAVVIFIFLYQNRIFKKSKVKKYYSVVWKKANRLTPRQVMHLRGSENTGFNPYYYHREEFNRAIQESIKNNQNVFIIGNPLAGKTRMVYQNLKKLKNAEVIIPRDVMISMEDFLIPRSFTPWRKKILLLDDLNKYTDNPNFTHLLREFADKDILIIATCRSGPELESAENKLEQYISSLFKYRLKIPEIDRELAEKVAGEVNVKLPETFDGNIGSIFLPLDTMIDRYKACPEQQKCIMRSIKRLYLAGVTEAREAFSLENVKKVCVEKEGIDFREFEWSKHLGELKNNGLIAYENDSIEIEETYLDNVIDTEFDTLANLRQMYDMFQDDPDTLFKIGFRASNIGNVDLRRADFKKLAIKAYTKTLDFYTYDNNPEGYAVTRNNLGATYQKLAEIEDRATNCKLAIESFQEALKVHTFGRFQMDYAMTQNNLGAAYGTLAEVEHKVNNCKLAIESYQEALKVYTIERFPIQYAVTRHNLGTAHSILAVVEDRAINCKLAIESYQEALKLRTVERFQMDYAMTQNNLGATYGTLAEVEDKVNNCKLAIESYQEALKVRTVEHFPIDYAMTMYNLGLVYITLAEDGNKESNCREARNCFDESLACYRKLNIASYIERVENAILQLDEFCEGGRAC